MRNRRMRCKLQGQPHDGPHGPQHARDQDPVAPVAGRALDGSRPTPDAQLGIRLVAVFDDGPELRQAGELEDFEHQLMLVHDDHLSVAPVDRFVQTHDEGDHGIPM